MEAVRLKATGVKRMRAQSGNGSGSLAGNPHPFPTTVFSPDNEDPIINVQSRAPDKQVLLARSSMAQKLSDATVDSSVSMVSEDDSNLVVDMGDMTLANQSIRNLVSSVRVPGMQREDCNIKWRTPVTVISDPTDFQPAESTQAGGWIIDGDDTEVLKLLSEESTCLGKGVICNSQVLCSDNGDYSEGKQYTVCPGSKLKGAFGEAILCQDQKSGKTFIRKTVLERLMKNEVKVPLMFRDCPGIPEVYGIIQRPRSTEIFQEFAGLSLDKLCSSQYAMRFRDPQILLGLAFQGFRTLEKLHSKGIFHLDIKPQNICVDLGQRVPCLKFIDFGSCQLPGEVTRDGVTYEYLSPESCLTLFKLAHQEATRDQQKETSFPQTEASEGRLEAGADVWAFTLSLMYCLYGYHLMVYACTGSVAYPEDKPEQIAKLRIQCLAQITKKTDADMAKLIRSDWADVLKVLFMNTLRVNPDDRWSAGKAASFILHCLNSAQRVTPQPSVPALGVRLRVRTAENPRQGVLVPGTIVASPAVQPFQQGEPVPQGLAQPGKRKCAGGSPTQGFKVIRK